jgi:hypothetical protein
MSLGGAQIPEGPLDELAARLVIPARSGVYLTKSELIVLARLSEGSLRVSERRRMLADVLKSPDSPAGLAALIARLADFCRAHVERYDELAATWPRLAAHVAPWRAQAERTLASLVEIERELQALDGGGAR